MRSLHYILDSEGMLDYSDPAVVQALIDADKKERAHCNRVKNARHNIENAIKNGGGFEYFGSALNKVLFKKYGFQACDPVVDSSYNIESINYRAWGMWVGDVVERYLRRHGPAMLTARLMDWLKKRSIFDYTINWSTYDRVSRHRGWGYSIQGLHRTYILNDPSLYFRPEASFTLLARYASIHDCMPGCDMCGTDLDVTVSLSKWIPAETWNVFNQHFDPCFNETNVIYSNFKCEKQECRSSWCLVLNQYRTRTMYEDLVREYGIPYRRPNKKAIRETPKDYRQAFVAARLLDFNARMAEQVPDFIPNPTRSKP